MSFIKLTPEESINVAIIDDQHKSIANIVNNIHQQLAIHNKQVITQLLNSLIEEIEIHFETEEKMMKDTKFLGYFSHKLEHDRFYNQMLQTVNGYKANPTFIDEDKLIGIKKWLFNHIELSDKKCGVHFNTVGIS